MPFAPQTGNLWLVHSRVVSTVHKAGEDGGDRRPARRRPRRRPRRPAALAAATNAAGRLRRRKPSAPRNRLRYRWRRPCLITCRLLLKTNRARHTEDYSVVITSVFPLADALVRASTLLARGTQLSATLAPSAEASKRRSKACINGSRCSPRQLRSRSRPVKWMPAFLPASPFRIESKPASLSAILPHGSA